MLVPIHCECFAIGGVDPFDPLHSPGDVICFNTPAEQFAFWDNTVVRSINETISTNFRDPNELKEFFSRVPETNDKLKKFGEKCLASNTGPYLQYIGTTSTIRDLVSLADKINGPGHPIDYYGYSYGTILGFYFLSLFPDRIGHFILDGVVNPSKWGRYDLDYVTLLHTEDAFSTFANACAEAGASKCLPVGMIHKNATGSDVRALITSTIDLALKLQKIGYTQLPQQAGELKASLFDILYFPALWQAIANQAMYPVLVSILAAGRAHGLTDPYILPAAEPVGPLPNIPQRLSYSLEAIVGADGAASNGVPLEKVFQDLVMTTRDRTPTFGAMWSGFAAVSKWPVRSVEKLPTFKHKTLKNRILVIGNTIDPITPLEGAEYVAGLLGSDNAVLVEHQAVGHTSLSQYSNCTSNIVLKFLLNSQLPHKNTKCAPNSNDFFPETPTNARALVRLKAARKLPIRMIL